MLRKEDFDQGSQSSADQRMEKEDRGLACHGVECLKGIDRDNARVQ